MIFDNFLATSKHKKGILKVEVINMKKAYEKSLQMIKELNIKTEKEYIKIVKEKEVLTLPSLKYIACTDKFTDILELAKEVA